MANLDAAALAENALRLGLITREQLEDGWEEVGEKRGEPEPLLAALERKGFLTPWQSQKLLKEDPDGYFLGGYRILYKIGSGSFGRVYRADDPRTGTVVAVKVLRGRWSDSKHNIELFEREGKVGMTLRHPNLVEMLAVNRDPTTKQYYIVMEFVEGGNLRDILTIRKKMEPVEALRILDDAATGLAYAYTRGVTHRDMKLTNILVSSGGTAKLVDFGLAGIYGKMQGDHVHVDRTVDYAGLENATSVKSGDTRSDIFFLGCVAYETLTGRPPLLMSRNPRERMSPDRFRNVQPLGRDEVAAPASLFRLIETMMCFYPPDRYQTPSQLLDAIRVARRDLEGGAAPAHEEHAPAPVTRSIFIVEKDERLQDLLRDKFKDKGYRVLLAGDPARAVDRFRRQPFDILVVNGGTTGDDGIMIFDRLMSEAHRQELPCVGVLMLSNEQKGWIERMPPLPNYAVLMHPVKLKQLLRKVEELLEGPPPGPAEGQAEDNE